MEIGVGIGVLLASIAFCVLVVYGVRTLQSLRNSLDEANRTLQEVQKQLDSVSAETVKLIQSSHQLTADVQTKMKQLDTAFGAVLEVSGAVHEVTSSVKQVSSAVSHTVRSNVEGALHKHQGKLAEATEWVTLALQAWQKIQSYRKTSKGEDSNVEQ